MNVENKFFKIIEPSLNNNDFSGIVHIRREDDITSILIMAKNGHSFARIYWFYDDEYKIYFEGLSVSPEFRKLGLGNKLLSIFEDIAKKLLFKNLLLFVKKDSWLFDWYVRKGYKQYRNHKNQLDCIWMQKKLKTINNT